MNCKNCNQPLSKEAHFCNNCGAKVVLNRIDFKNLLLDFFIVNFGVDSRFFLTIRKMATHPEDVLNEYLEGVRRRYVNPFAFLAVGAALSLIIFNYFADDFIAIQSNVNSENIEHLKKAAEKDVEKTEGLSEKEVKKLKIEKKTAQFQLDLMESMWDFMLRYFNLLTFVFLLIYAVLSKWTFWKPHNFGEHIVMNGYIYGFTTYITLIAFFFAIVIHPTIYIATFFISIVYYMYAFGRFYKLSIGRNIIKLFRFFIGLIILFILFVIITVVLGIIAGATGLIKF
ncbi:DUF3667 domain-containing protein [Polaribacter porphyrae]|uniref:Zinc-ribbon domain-containing protein n=1 Tax=Polaribacter porphyrae TaxID=1137780 RepID=A0A2S7WT27_9FLAO|nr:DUF3667 domain-containing protein [Polaribacter porphyrae]PQJ80743.1 hypothetical protein BTO18_16885 [Polaribacter porphyrae]